MMDYQERIKAKLMDVFPDAHEYIDSGFEAISTQLDYREKPPTVAEAILVVGYALLLQKEIRLDHQEDVDIRLIEMNNTLETIATSLQKIAGAANEGGVK